MSLGEATSNVTFEPKPRDWVVEWSPWRARVWIELRDSLTEWRLQTWRPIVVDLEPERDLAKPS